ncbi:hypothetical protein FB45DRAFT_868356 [Roridomyces roridus]|uniref:Uncharacterized protein n=1 Tax=Roridomyces roridus TaxID=1738132 RepID=A0AAD7BPU1_9AGAR|nr:hypothetical protein FB45DRAFT_868356 [Roridomyces roridus]
MNCLLAQGVLNIHRITESCCARKPLIYQAGSTARGVVNSGRVYYSPWGRQNFLFGVLGVGLPIGKQHQTSVIACSEGHTLRYEVDIGILHYYTEQKSKLIFDLEIFTFFISAADSDSSHSSGPTPASVAPVPTTPVPIATTVASKPAPATAGAPKPATAAVASKAAPKSKYKPNQNSTTARGLCAIQWSKENEGDGSDYSAYWNGLGEAGQAIWKERERKVKEAAAAIVGTRGERIGSWIREAVVTRKRRRGGGCARARSHSRGGSGWEWSAGNEQAQQGTSKRSRERASAAGNEQAQPGTSKRGRASAGSKSGRGSYR